MEERRLQYGVTMVVCVSVLCGGVWGRGSKVQCECSLNQSRSFSLDITCSNHQVDDVGVSCTKEERVRIPRGYRYIPGYGFYRLYRTAHFWSRAKATCRQDGGRLAIPRDAALATTLWELFRQDAYVGISDAASEGVFTDVTGKLAPFLKWQSGEPNGDRNENCVALYSGGHMNDLNCAWGFPFICERPFTSLLPEGYEFLDGFGFYKVHTTKATFEEAEDVCQGEGEGGHLFVLDSLEEAEAVTALVKRWPTDLGAVWTGLNDTISEGNFVTFSGKAMGFRNWRYGEPNNGHGGEGCVLFFPSGDFNDERCNLQFNFLCVIPPPWTTTARP